MLWGPVRIRRRRIGESPRIRPLHCVGGSCPPHQAHSAGPRTPDARDTRRREFRAASDRRRHKQKIDKAIKEGIHSIVADESIIGQDGKKKIRIPVRGIKEYRFVYGKSNGSKGVGSAQGKDIKKGQIILPS